MTDNDVLDAVRRQFDSVRMDTPVGQIVHRGRARRRHRQLSVLGAAAAVVVTGVVLGITTVGSGGTHAPPVRLAAWTVHRNSDDTVSVNIRQFTDPAGLQRALRADGVPANVAFSSESATDPALPAECHKVSMSDQENASLQAKIFVFRNPFSDGGLALTINTTAIPKDVGVYLAVHDVPRHVGWGTELVQASPGCTG